MTLPRGVWRGGGPVGDFYVDDYAFEICVVLVAGGFVAQDAIDGLFLFLRPLGLLRTFNFNIFQHRGHRGIRDFLAFRDYDFLRDFCVDGSDVISASTVVEDAYYCGMSAVDGADDASFGAAVGADVGDVDQHEVAVHGVADLVRGDEDVSGEFGFEWAERFGIGDNEAESVAVHGEASGDEVLVGGGLRELVMVGVDGDQLAGFDQFLQVIC